nr:hypothetical protein [Cupriavidus taiwanensis]
MIWTKVLFAVAFVLGLAAIVAGAIAAQIRFERYIDKDDRP